LGLLPPRRYKKDVQAADQNFPRILLEPMSEQRGEGAGRGGKVEEGA